MLKRIICTFLLVLLGFGISTQASAADRYKWIKSTDQTTISYDAQTVRFNSTGGKTVDLWILTQYTEEGTRKFLEKAGVSQESKWGNFSYDMTHFLLNSNYQCDMYEVVFYDYNGNVLYSTPINHEWRSVIPGTLSEDIFNAFAFFLKDN